MVPRTQVSTAAKLFSGVVGTVIGVRQWLAAHAANAVDGFLPLPGQSRIVQAPLQQHGGSETGVPSANGPDEAWRGACSPPAARTHTLATIANSRRTFTSEHHSQCQVYP